MNDSPYHCYIYLFVSVSSAAHGYWIPPTLLHQTPKPLLLPGKQTCIVSDCCQQTQQWGFVAFVGNNLALFSHGVKITSNQEKQIDFYGVALKDAIRDNCVIS